MGTEYSFGTVGEQQTRLSVYEMSGVFSLYAEVSRTLVPRLQEELQPEAITTDGMFQLTLADKIDPADLFDVAIRIMRAAGYGLHDEEIRAKLPKLQSEIPELFN